MNIVPVPINNAQAPAVMRQRMAANAGNNSGFASNVIESFPTLSIKGKVFRAKIAGQEQAFMDPQTRTPMAYLDVILVEGSPMLAKSYYAKGYTEGDADAPNCWSLDSIRPDPSVAQKVSPVCGNCPMNQFGSRITDNGKAAKACSDYRRIAITLPHMLDGTNEVMTFLMKVPQSSLKNLKAYADLLQRHQFEPRGAVTRITFDHQEAYPKLIFNFVAPLSDPEYQNVLDLSQGPTVKGMLSAPDFENAPSTHPVQADTMAGMVRQAAPVLTPVGQPEQFHDAGPKPTLSQPVQAAPTLVPDAGLIELPDGKLYNPMTGLYVERPQPAVQMPELDPDVLKLPDGKFFNKATGQYVNGPEVGSKPAGAEPATTKPARVRAKKPEVQAAPDAAEAQPEKAQANVEELKPTVSAAPRSMDEILMNLGKPAN